MTFATAQELILGRISKSILVLKRFFVTKLARSPVLRLLEITTSRLTPMPEPLLFRGLGNGSYQDWKRGDKVWVDGVPCGCLLIHNSILRWCWDNAEPYRLPDGTEVRKVFHTPREAGYDPETGGFHVSMGTEDLWWCDNLIKNKVLQKTGWKKLAKKKYPFLLDTAIFCQHIDPDGMQYPANVGIK